jgi:hypothetical protein
MLEEAGVHCLVPRNFLVGEDPCAISGEELADRVNANFPELLEGLPNGVEFVSSVYSWVLS